MKGCIGNQQLHDFGNGIHAKFYSLVPNDVVLCFFRQWRQVKWAFVAYFMWSVVDVFSK